MWATGSTAGPRCAGSTPLISSGSYSRRAPEDQGRRAKKPGGKRVRQTILQPRSPGFGRVSKNRDFKRIKRISRIYVFPATPTTFLEFRNLALNHINIGRRTITTSLYREQEYRSPDKEVAVVRRRWLL
jgi:hypothetical protein